MTNQCDSEKGKSIKNTHKRHKNSKTYLDAQNEFAPKLQVIVGRFRPNANLPCSLLRLGCHWGNAIQYSALFSTEGPLVMKFF